ncbi:MAG: PilC/PilY family type IV pilus protein [Gallionellaceae bacterium]|nr:PilC/PilY family type IV pilus protein [Gallionellaceae bacterium]
MKIRLFTLLAGLFLSVSGHAGSYTLSDVPLYLTVGVPPNIILTLDDSGSMDNGYVPDGISNTTNSKRYKSAYFNAMYYNPAITYNPPPKYDGKECTIDSADSDPTCYPNASFTAAPMNGFAVSNGTGNTVSTSNYCNPASVSNLRSSPVNLSSDYAATNSYAPNSNSQTCTASDANSTSESITYNYGPTACRVDFDNNGSNDRIQVETGCSGWSNNLDAGATLVVSGASSRNGTYTVESVNGTDIYIRLGNSTNPWSSDLNNENISLSWTRTATVTISAYSAYYYRFYLEAGVARPSSCTTTTANQKTDDACYLRVAVGSADDIYKKPDGSAADQARKQQNFANWYSYYRTRNLATVSGAMTAFAGVDGRVRLAWQALSTCKDDTNLFTSTGCKGWDNPTTGLDNRIRALDENDATGYSHRRQLYSWLARLPASGYTPLRSAAIRAGRYVDTSVTGLSASSPYAETPPGTAGTYYSCRRNVHMMMTDGLWNTNTESITPSVGNANSTAVNLPSGSSLPSGSTTWTPDHPYTDSNSNDMADIAFYYWKRDLAADTVMANTLLPILRDQSGDSTAQWVNPKNDPADWQHMTTYAVSLGLTSLLTNPAWGGSTFAGDYPALASGTKSWPTTSSDSANNVYDLWHAAISSRGKFFSAENASDVANAFQTILKEVGGDSSSSASLAANSTKLQTAEDGSSLTVVYQAKFDPKDWSGQLVAYHVQGDGSPGSPDWDASNPTDLTARRIYDPSARRIYTQGGGGGVNFQWGNLTTGTGSQQALLNQNLSGTTDGCGPERLAYLRGVTTNTGTSGTFTCASGSVINKFRPRSRPLGDIINSNPIYVSSASQGYAALPDGTPGKTTYGDFLTFKKTRQPLVYVGANDGMLHAFLADNGEEVFAVVPKGVYGNLSKLTDLNYTHLFYVDGSPNANDAYLSNSHSATSGWNTVVVSSLGAGGNSVFAVDATKTDAADLLATKFMWEYTEADMGYTFGQPQIGYLNNGQWAAIFGNGHKTSGGGAHFYIVNLANGTLIKKISIDPAKGGINNGLSTPALLDSDGNKTIDYAYAGDLNGNLWKFDLSSANPAAWGVAYADPLFKATGPSSTGTTIAQPITAQPSVIRNVTGGYWIYFGTGRFFASGDKDPPYDTQTLYGIWDNGSSAVPTYRSRSDVLTQHSILAETKVGSYTYRTTSNETVSLASSRGWYMDLLPPGSTTSIGERVVSRAITVQDNVDITKDRVIFVTLRPDPDPCKSGGTSWLMEFGLSGGRPDTPVFDLNGDGLFTDADKIDGNIPTGIQSTVGIVNTPTWMDKDASIAFKLLSGTSGGIMSIKNRGLGTASGVPVRIYWQQLM